MLKNRLFASLMFIFMASSLSSCATNVNNVRLNVNAQKAFERAEIYIESNKIEEGLTLLNQVNVVHGDDEKVKKLLKKIPKDKSYLLAERNKLLGYNKNPFRKQIPATITRKIVMYIPDRIKDFTEIFTAELNIGYEFGAGLWVTRGAQAIVYSGATMGVGLYQKEGLGARAEGSGEYGIGPFVGAGLVGIRAGTGGTAMTAAGIIRHLPHEYLYQDYRDYWAIGAKVGFLFVGAEAEIHPLEIADFFTGIVGYDLLQDDWATTRGLKLSSTDKKIMRDLGKEMRNLDDVNLTLYKREFPHLFPPEYAKSE